MKKLLLSGAVLALSGGLNAQINTFPWVEDFDTQALGPTGCGPTYTFTGTTWQNGDDAGSATHFVDWTVHNAGTSSGNTGPSADHTTGATNYIYCETSCSGTGYSNSTFELWSPWIDLTTTSGGGIEFSFWYHAYGTSMGNLTVEARDGSVGPTSTWTQIAGPITDNLDQWQNAAIDISALATADSLQIRFVYVSGTSFGGDIGLDDISIYETVFDGAIVEKQDITCAGDSAGWLIAEAVYGTPPYTYNWDNGSTNDTLSNVPAGIYCVTIMDAAGDSVVVCDTIVELTPALGVSASATPIVCVGDSNGMAWIDTAFGGTPNLGCGLSTAVCSGSPMSILADSGTIQNTETGYPAVFGNWYWGAKHQILYTAAELNSLGFTGGNIDSISIFVDSVVGTALYENFNIRMGCTGSTNLDAGWETGLTEVFPATNINLVDDTTIWFVFPQAYYWDGVSSLVIETCFNNSSFTNNSFTNHTTVGYTAVRYYRADNATVCSSTNTSGTSADRPNFTFAFCNASPSPYIYTWSTGDMTDTTMMLPAGTYTVTVQDINGCSAMDTVMIMNNTPISGVADVDFCDGDMGMADAGAGYTSYMWSNGDTTQMTSISMAGSYHVDVVDTNGCMSSDTIMANALPLPTPSISGAVDTICYTQSITLDAGAGFSSYSWSTGGNAQSEMITGSNLSVGSNSVTVMVSDANNCMNSDTVMIYVDQCTSLDENSLGLSAYPNPTENILQLNIENGSNQANITISDVNGKVVFVKAINGKQATLDLSALSKGVYMLSVESDGALSTMRLIKE